MAHLIASFRIAPEDRETLTRLATASGRSRSDVVRAAIRRYATDAAINKESRPGDNGAALESLQGSDYGTEGTGPG